MKLIITLVGRKPIVHKMSAETLPGNQISKFADELQELLASNKTLSIELNGKTHLYRVDQIQSVEVSNV